MIMPQQLLKLLMIILENLKLQAAKKSFLNSSRKYLRISINEHLFSTQTIAKVKSQTLLEWEEPATLPLFLGLEYVFEVFEKHQFGYNPEELNKIVSGRFVLSKDDKEDYASWEVFTDKKQKYGFLTANIRRKQKYNPKLAVKVAEEQILIISSIIANLPSVKHKRAFIIGKLEGKEYKTGIEKCKAGQALFADTIEISKTDVDNEINLEVYGFDAKEEKSELIGKGTLDTDESKGQKKIPVINEKGQNVGQLFIDHRTIDKNTYHSSKILTQIVQQGNLNKSINLSKSIDLEHKVSISPMTASYLSKTRKRSDEDLILKRSQCVSGRVSVINHNNSIFMPTEKRFMSYQDKQSDRITYLQEEQRDFNFMDKHAKMFYKGASIGKGQKHDFTTLQKQNPGVGVYHLPSIWDRY